MCGIAGEVRRHGSGSAEIVERQLAQVLHRGPDAVGFHASGPAAIGQTRLAIIDLVTGDPPITSSDGSIVVALNGEIYNFRELRRELAEAGHNFRTNGDTEVLVHLAEGGSSAVATARALDGMFAAAIWDGGQGKLSLLRDRAGKKPLYYWAGTQAFVFGSEIKALLAHPDVPRQMAREALPAYLGFGYVPTPRTFFDGILSVPPGHVLTVDRELRVEVERYWAPSAPGIRSTRALDVGLDEAAALVESSLESAVAKRLVAAVSIGAFLSGGIDSSAVVAIMAEKSGRPVKTFTIGFEKSAGFDERPFARLIAKRFDTEHTEFVVAPSAVDLVEQLVFHHDQPFGDSSAIPTYLLAQLTRQEVTVALCGDGGDELFAGYERFAAALAVGRLRRLPPAACRAAAQLGRLAARTGSARVEKINRFLGAAGAGLPDALRSWVSYTPDEIVAELAGCTSDWALADYTAKWDATAGAPTLDRLLLLNFDTYLLDDLLPKVDRTTMAHGLEVRSPFLDSDLVELAMRLPPTTKLRGFSLKRCLKRAMATRLPHEILHRPKRGFGVPLDRWFREDLDTYVDSMIGHPNARIREFLDDAGIDRLLGEHRAATSSHGSTLWTLLTLEVFLRDQGW